MNFPWRREFDNEQVTITLGTSGKEITLQGVIVSDTLTIYGSEYQGYWVKIGHESGRLTFFTTVDQALKYAQVSTNDPATLLRLAALQSSGDTEENIRDADRT